jgi:hypothetical protein
MLQDTVACACLGKQALQVRAADRATSPLRCRCDHHRSIHHHADHLRHVPVIGTALSFCIAPGLQTSPRQLVSACRRWSCCMPVHTKTLSQWYYNSKSGMLSKWKFRCDRYAGWVSCHPAQFFRHPHLRVRHITRRVSALAVSHRGYRLFPALPAVHAGRWLHRGMARRSLSGALGAASMGTLPALESGWCAPEQPHLCVTACDQHHFLKRSPDQALCRRWGNFEQRSTLI